MCDESLTDTVNIGRHFSTVAPKVILIALNYAFRSPLNSLNRCQLKNTRVLDSLLCSSHFLHVFFEVHILCWRIVCKHFTARHYAAAIYSHERNVRPFVCKICELKGIIKDNNKDNR